MTYNTPTFSLVMRVTCPPQGAASTGLLISPQTFGSDVEVSVFVQALSSLGIAPVNVTQTQEILSFFFSSRLQKEIKTKHAHIVSCHSHNLCMCGH
jgi:hypothetical protein